MGVKALPSGRGLRVLGIVTLALVILTGFTAGVLAKYISTTTEKTVEVDVVNQWSSADAGQSFPVDVYVRAYVTKEADENGVIDGTSSMSEPVVENASSWQTLDGDAYCFYYVGTGGIVSGGTQVPTLELKDASSYKVVYEFLEAGVTDGGKLTCQAAWDVTIGDGSVVKSS